VSIKACYEHELALARQYIEKHEGPRTPFVLINRACEFSGRNQHMTFAAANALHALLLEMVPELDISKGTRR
jgi:hypothetical protein